MKCVIVNCRHSASVSLRHPPVTVDGSTSVRVKSARRGSWTGQITYVNAGLRSVNRLKGWPTVAIGCRGILLAVAAVLSASFLTALTPAPANAHDGPFAVHQHCVLPLYTYESGYSAASYSEPASDWAACDYKRVDLTFMDRFYYEVRTYKKTCSATALCTTATNWNLICYGGKVWGISNGTYQWGWNNPGDHGYCH